MPGPLHGVRVVDLTQMVFGIEVEGPGRADLTRQPGPKRNGLAARRERGT